MSRIFITGSTDGLGALAAGLLISQGHAVVLHARNIQRAEDAVRRLPAAESVVIGDLSSISQTRSVAEQINKLGRFDAVIHNAGVGYDHFGRIETEDKLPHIFAVNVLAPYILTALIHRPERLIYLGSSMHHGVKANLSDIRWLNRAWNGMAAYSESKFYDVMLAFAISRYWPDCYANAVDPGWVPTRMGGSDAPDDLDKGYETQAWLAISRDPAACVSGKYFHHMKAHQPDPAVYDENLQDRFMSICKELTGIAMPDHKA